MITYDGYKLDHWDLREKNSSRTYYTGSRWYNKLGEGYTIVGQINKYDISDKGHHKYQYFVALFDDGHYNNTRTETIRRKNTFNPYTPTVREIGCIGQGPWGGSTLDGEESKIYNVWCGMLFRCSHTELSLLNAPSYADCIVAPRWLVFQNFCEDLSHMDNFNLYNTTNSEYNLDKDILIPGNRLYSKDTCLIVLDSDNKLEMNIRTIPQRLTGETYIGTNNKLGLRVEFENQRAFCREYKLRQSHVWKIINKYPHHLSHKGWTFKIKEEIKNK